MAKQTLSFDISPTYVAELASALTRFIASDPDVVLQNDTMEGASTISISDWQTVEQTIALNLQQWIYQLSTKQALTIPIPVPIYNLLALVVERGARDHRGTVSFKIDASPADVEIASSSALFGEGGYFSRTMKSFTNADYLAAGKRRKPQIILVRENDLTKKGDPFSTKVVEIDPYRLPFQTDYGVFSGLEGFDVDNSNLYILLPTMKVQGDRKTVDSRLVSLVQDDMFPSAQDASRSAKLAALWIVSHVGGACYGVRNVMEYQVNKDLCSELIRSLLISERLTPYRDLPSTVPALPFVNRTVQSVLAVLEVLNPTVVEHTDYEYINTISQSSRHLLCPSVLTESFRSHVSRFLTYNSAGEFTGTMLTYPDLVSGSFEELVQEFKYNPSQSIDAQQTVKTMNIWRQIMELYPNLQPAPAISLDYNRVPITVKYCALVKSEGEDNTGLPMELFSSKLSSSEVVRFLSRIEFGKPDDVNSVEQDLQRSFGFKQRMQETAAFIVKLSPKPSDDEPVRLENVQAPKEVLSELDTAMDTSSPRIAGEFEKKGVYYYFTKFKEPQVILTADKFTSLLHYPYINSHGLVSRGYTKISKIRVWPALEISSASVVDQSGKPVTEYGRLLKGLARRGGFGFGSLLGPLLGTAGGAVGDLLGVPGLGDLGSVLGGTIGSLIPI